MVTEENKSKSSENLELATTYWRMALEGCEATPFPALTAAVGEPVPNTKAYFEYKLPAACDGTATSTLIRAAWAIIASRYTNSDDVVFGAAVMRRKAPDIGSDPILVPLGAIVPVRVRVAGDQAVSAFIEDVQQQSIDMSAYEEMGLHRISKIGGGARHACHFQTLLMVEEGQEITGRGILPGNWLDNQQAPMKYGLILQCTAVARKLHIVASFDRRILEDWLVRQLLGQFSLVIQQLAGMSPKGKVEDISTLTSEDRHLLRMWNREVPPAVERCVHDLFIEQARARPDAPAIHAWDGEMTYGELDELSSRLASHLVELGIKPEDIVPICFEKSKWAIVAILAVLKAGAAFFIFDASLPRERLKLILQKTSNALALASQASETVIKGLVMAVVVVTQDLLLQVPAHVLCTAAVQPTNSAYIIFTSGSTGEPKGCVIEHRSACTALLGHGHRVNMSGNTRTLQFGSYAFTAALIEIFMTFAYGGCVCIPSEEERTTGLALAISKMKINWAFLTPTVVDLLSPQSVPSLSTLCVGGEAMRISHIAHWGDEVHLLQFYGGSEMGAISSHRLTSTSTNKDIGKASTGIIWIVDPNDHNKLAPLGAVGELLVEGHVIGREYINEPDKTAATFIEAPEWMASFRNGTRRLRLYKTGDLAQQKQDGSIELQGRKDNQVKLRGQRIELGEIEHQARLAKADVKEIAVELIQPQNTKTATLGCFFVTGSGIHNQADGSTNYSESNGHVESATVVIRQRLEQQLPQYMVPTLFMQMESLPKTPSKKIDRKRLRGIGESLSAQQLVELRTQSQGPKRQPSTEVEKTLQRLWARVLNLQPEAIGVDDSFFRLGGDSITAMMLVAEAHKQDIQLTVKDIFQRPNLSHLSGLCRTASGIVDVLTPFSMLNPKADVEQVREEVASACSADPDLVEDVYPCSPLQEGMLSLTTKRPGDYIMQYTLALEPTIDTVVFQAAWQQVVQSTPILRARIVHTSKTGLLHTVLAGDIQWVQMEVEGLDKYLEQDKAAQMGLGEPLARYALVKESKQDKTWFVWTVHHALHDGWSLPRILENVRLVYSGVMVPQQPDYQAFIQYLSRQDQEAAAAYWRASLADCKATPFPLLPSTTKQPVASGIAEYQCPPLAKVSSDTTTSTLIRAAWAILASQYTNSDDVVFGATVSGRNAPVVGIEAMLGPTIATVPCILTTEGIKITASFDPRAIEQQQADKMLGQFSFIMQQLAIAAANDQTVIANIEILTADDTQLLWMWNREVPPAVERCVHDLFIEQARARPDAPAIHAWDGEMTYSELDELSSRLAGHLVDLGIKTEDIVPLCFEKSIWTVVAMLAVLKAGGAFTSLDPDHPRSRHEEILKQINARVVLTSAQCSALLVGPRRTIVAVSETAMHQLSNDTTLAHSVARPNHIAYVIFTSGSTGIPKGIVMEHEAVSTGCLSHGKMLAFGGHTRALQFSSYTFDVCIAEIITTLIYGGTVCVPSEVDRRDNLAQIIHGMDANWAFLTPSVARLLEPTVELSLETLVFGGEQINSTDWERWEGYVRRMNGYGPTECCICSSFSDPQEFVSGKIGKSIASVSWVVDPLDHNRLAPLGAIGELLVEGPILARGYLDNVEKTAAAFIRDPAWLMQGGGGQPGRRGRLYKTGDLVRYGIDGNLIFIGRKDSQVKVRGHRVELEEIEHHIRVCVPYARQVAAEVTFLEEEKSKAILAVFLEPDKETQPAFKPNTAVQTMVDNSLQAQIVFLDNIDARMADRVPSYMVPDVYFTVPDLPMTTSGKVDRKQLREIGASLSAQQLVELRTQSQGPKRQPSTEVEKTLQRLWARVLNLQPEAIGVDDSFFRLGGDSITAMKLAAEARKECFQLTVADVFEQPRLCNLARLSQNFESIIVEEIKAFSLLGPGVDVSQVRADVAAGCDLDASMIQDSYPCSTLQEGLLSLSLKRPGDYIMQGVLELSVDINEDAFRAAWEQVVRSSAVLRTRIVQHSELGLLQVITADGMRWVEADDLDAYLAEDKLGTSSLLGAPLARYALVKESLGKRRWFVWAMHHALYDGQTLPRIVDAVQKAYMGGELEKEVGFNTFIKYLGQQNQEAAVAYWRANLANCIATPFPSLQSTAKHPISDAIVEYQCPPLAKVSSDTTTSTLIRAAWAILASQYTNSDDVVFGATVSGRNAPVVGIEAMLGPTIATVPVRVCLERDQAVSTFLKVLQRQSTEMIPFEQTGIQQITKMGTGPRHACNFQTLLVIQPAEEGFGTDGMLGTWRSTSELQSFTTYALTVQCTLTTKGVKITVSFDHRTIEQWQVEKMLGQFSFIMEQLAIAGANDQTVIANIKTLTTGDRQLLWMWNREVPPAVERCLHDLFIEQARARPDAPAICAWDGEMTYSELDELSSRLAGHLVDLGIKTEDIVPLCFEKSIWTVVAMLAVLKAGGAFTPLDPEHPRSRHEEILKQTRATVVLTSAQYAAYWGNSNCTVVAISSSSARQLPIIKYDSPLNILPNHPAYILFTSGSTGIPKGVVLEHQAVCTGCLGHGKAYQLSSTTRFLQFAAYTFDVSITEILTTLLYGGTICVPSETRRRNNLTEAINELGANCADLTPTVARLLDPQAILSLKTLVLGGDFVSQEDYERWKGRVEVINAYGPTECCVTCIVCVCAPGFVGGRIGKSIASASWVVDPLDHNRLAPLGAIGELLVEGPILARGYLDNAEKTAAAFIHDPAWLMQGGGGQPGRRGRLYKTGDLVRYGIDGNLIYVGRKDSQVKVRGHRVELEEIEHHIRVCVPYARQVAAEVIFPGEKIKAILAVFLEPDKEKQAISRPSNAIQTMVNDSSQAQIVFLANIGTRMADRVPSYMVPDVYFTVAELPMTTSGKVDRKRLREIGASLSAQQLAELRTHSEGPKRQPSTQVERILQRLWAQVLNVNPETIGLDDSFFDLGGDSIIAMKLVAEARRLGVQLTVATIFQSPRLFQLCYATTTPTSSSPDIIPHICHLGPVEQSFAQSRLWFLEQLYPGLNWYLMPFAVRIRGPLQLASLHAALLAVENRHESLRTTFATNGGVGVQIIQPFQGKGLNIIDMPLSGEDSLQKAVERDQRTPFNLLTEPGWRASVFRVDSDDHVLSIVMHHIVSDGWSVDVLMSELAKFYAASLRGQDLLSQVRPLPIQYRDFSIWQRQQAQIDEHQRQLSYWVAHLQTSRAAELPCDNPRPATLSGNAGIRNVGIDNILYAKLQAFCSTRGVTPFVVLLAVFRATHYRLTGQDDATIGTANANRDRWELGDIVGFFVNLQCLRISIQKESFEELVRQVHAVTVASLANQDVPFERIVSELKNDRDLSRHPLVQLVFVVHSQRGAKELILEDVQTETLHCSITSRFDLEFHFYPEPHGLEGTVLFSTDLYASETVETMISLFLNILERCLTEPKAVIASLPLMTETDYSQLDKTGLIQVEETDYPRELSVVDLFRQQASAFPSTIAIRDSSAELTYAQLERQSDTLARWLARRLLSPETLVGVFASRSCQTVVAFLGILKANMAYLPFDVKIPSKRMEAILSSLPGQRIIFLGPCDHLPDIKQNDVEFVRITDALQEEANGTYTGHRTHAVIAPSATSLAYVMFTSGSTGQPKGVMAEHRGIVRLVKDGDLARLLPTCGAMAHISNLAFDASTWEIYAALLNGMTLACIDTMEVLDQSVTLRIFTEWDVQTAFLTTALFRQYAVECPKILTRLAMLCVGGERLDHIHLSEFMKYFTGKFVHVYGPTENTTFSTAYHVPRTENFVNSVPIGRAISNSGAYVMDQEQRLVPLGVIGELVVTGDGLARGYTEPERNIDRFITTTIGDKTIRAYRTGDFVRYRPTDCQLEFIGRIDGQVKIRGHRVELGEIENALRSHRSVSDAVVVSTQRDNDDQKLVACVTLEEGSIVPIEQLGDDHPSQHVEGWEDRFDSETYAPIEGILPEAIGRDFVGWTAMYDGREIDKVEMNEWLDDTMRTIYTTVHGRPGNVLEIGSGTGMILFNLLEGLQSYVGLDPSAKAVQFIKEAAKSIPSLADKVRMYKATATDISHIELSKSVDFVVLNSVVQYFPSQEYLFKVVQGLLNLEGVKVMFIGDVRSYALHREFLASRALRMAGDGASKEAIRRMVEDMEQVERELLVDPGFFTALPSRLPEFVEHVEILPKTMKAINELSCYRYAAVIHIKARGRPEREVLPIGHNKWVNFEEHKLNRQSLLQQLKSLSSLSTIAISNIPHSKTIFSRGLLGALDDSKTGAPNQREWVASVRRAAEQIPSLSAVDLVELAEEAGCRVDISWGRQHSQRGGLDAVFYQCQAKSKEGRLMFRFPTDHANRPQHCLSSKPLRQQLIQEVQLQLQEVLRAKLPEYMVPRSVNVLDNLPINENGKVDRSALAQRMHNRTTIQRSIRKPSTEVERTMQQLWAQVLHLDLESIGLDDSFFRLGGDSIAAMKLVAEARREAIQLSVADIFRNPTLVTLAGLDHRHRNDAVQEIPAFSLLGDIADLTQVREEVAASCSVDASLIEDIYPCSPLQEGLMSLTSKRAGDYVMQTVLLLREDIDEMAFRAAWDQVVQSAQVLRTRIVLHSKLGLLQAVTAESIQWTQADGLDDYLEQDQETSMGLGEHLVRYALVREGNGSKRWFVWTIHHSLYDGWSLPRILGTVEDIYDGGVTGRQRGFQAFIKYLGQQDRGAAMEYWQTILAHCQATPFPTLPSTVQQLVADTTVQYQCPPLLGTASDTTTSTLIRAAWAIVASRYTNSDDVVFGAVVTGRNAPVAAIEDILGPTIATVPVRVHVASNQTIPAYLQALQQQATDMIPFEQTGLQEIAKMGTGPRHACNFQTLLVVQPAGDDIETGMYQKWRGRLEQPSHATYGLKLGFVPTAAGLQIMASCDSRVMDHEQAERMLGQLSFVMQQLARAGLETKIADIDTLTMDEKSKIWEWNREVPPAVERCLHDLFIEQARARPDAPAICAWDGEMTYGELDELSTRLSAYLLDLGIEADDIVPLCFEKSVWTIVAMLAVLKAGGAFAPLDPEHPRSRHEEILQQTGAKAVLVSVLQSKFWKDLPPTIVPVDRGSIQQLPLETDHFRAKVRPSSLAYIMFTSGSTGVPKGVLIQHNSSCTSTLGHGKLFGLTPQTRFLQFASYTFDMCITEIFTTLLYGGCVCVPSETQRMNDLAAFMNKAHVSCANLTPTVARLLDPKRLVSLLLLIFGGEQVTSEDCRRWKEYVQVIIGYGPSECSVKCAVYSESEGFKSGMIGKSVASVSWVTDPMDHNRLAPLGSIGELLVEGPILARGYLNNAEKTEKAFVSDPAWLTAGYHGHPGRRARLYKTGDLVRYEPDGNLVYVCRKDTQVKIRGQRVELEEIEQNVRECIPKAKRLAVEAISLAGETDNVIIATFLESDDDIHGTVLASKPTHDESVEQVVFPAVVEQRLAERLPGYMMPTVFFTLGQLPKTASGKTDRKQLREIGASFSAQQLAEMRTQSQGQRQQPSTEVERILQQLWARVLNIKAESIGLEDNFFRLGGDSIAAMKLAAEARQEGICIKVADVFRSPLLSALGLCSQTTLGSIPEEIPPFCLVSQASRNRIFSDIKVNLPDIQVSDISDIAPATYMQELYITHGIRHPLQAFNYLFVDMGSLLDVQCLETSCRVLLDHLPILRTRFVFVEGKLWQVIIRNPELSFSSIEVDTMLPEASQALCLRDTENSSPLDLATSFTLIRNHLHEHRLVLRLSHAQYDGICRPAILKTLFAIYEQEQFVPLPSFSSYVADAQRRQSASILYWCKLLRGSNVTRATPELDPKVLKDVPLRIVQSESAISMPRLPTSVTAASLVSCAWAMVLSDVSGEEDVVYGHVVAGRNSDLPGITEVVGPCLNIIPVRALIRPESTSSSLLRSIQEQHVSLAGSDSIGWHDIVRNCTNWPVTAGFGSVLQYQNMDERPRVRVSGTLTMIDWFKNPFSITPYLAVIARPQGCKLRVSITGTTHILTAEYADMLLDMLCKAITRLSTDLGI
ncbi:Nonribosomal peptide synthetase TES [Fusarium oxysporum f. sp. rapae]|uniref:Nonribosomal peptide synthetase TES n=2 Tax=Fusarium oxysporum TaxID=5507 RepID=A0A8J5NUS7_FUSOX|nr:Nonribosomal peptide synthetase TES [Fusarium oxysporum f. sp. rapae]